MKAIDCCFGYLAFAIVMPRQSLRCDQTLPAMPIVFGGLLKGVSRIWDLLVDRYRQYLTGCPSGSHHRR